MNDHAVDLGPEASVLCWSSKINRSCASFVGVVGMNKSPILFWEKEWLILLFTALCTFRIKKDQICLHKKTKLYCKVHSQDKKNRGGLNFGKKDYIRTQASEGVRGFFKPKSTL